MVVCCFTIGLGTSQVSTHRFRKSVMTRSWITGQAVVDLFVVITNDHCGDRKPILSSRAIRGVRRFRFKRKRKQRSVGTSNTVRKVTLDFPQLCKLTSLFGIRPSVVNITQSKDGSGHSTTENIRQTFSNSERVPLIGTRRLKTRSTAKPYIRVSLPILWDSKFQN